MAWNEPGNNNNKDRDPWDKKDRDEQGPPDIDEMIRNFFGKFGGLSKRKGGRNGGLAPLWGGIIVIIVAIWLVSGFYTIKEAQRGVLLRFGKVTEVVQPGLHWKMTFVDRVIPVDVRSVRSLQASGFMLTKDENVVRVEMDVQYRVENPEQYLFSVTNPDNSLQQATDSALRYVVGHTSMDDILTTGREVVRQETRTLLEQIIKPYHMGLEIVDVNFLPARPPEEVKDAFDDAIAAQEDEQRYIREAEAYAKGVEPKARGQVQRVLQQAEAYKDSTVLQAKGAVARFDELLPEYKEAPKITRERLYLDAMQSVLQNTNKVMVDLPKQGSNNVIYLPLDKMSSSVKKPLSENAMSDVSASDTQASQQPIRSTSRSNTVRSGVRYQSGRGN
ncbi:FtsH protease activity modulator HflK [Dongshaea marina]|uniref:FtsH protease activity modulator HflK n=1 Tax=Dongshaea marina TaxID=2047966 RepID=UPI000D3EC503|nr:FtsH protease activity modulator HflK [Dongshaea marina]